jgi:pyridoxamine 5'-phosphate oxidase family protein
MNRTFRRKRNPIVPKKSNEGKEKLGQEQEIKLTRLEREYLLNKKIGRLATVSKAGEPHVVPVIFSLGDHDRIVISGAGFEKSLKFKNIKENPNVAFVVDSVRLSPWTPMGIELRGKAQTITMGNAQTGIEIIATKKAFWGLTEETVSPPAPDTSTQTQTT